MYEFVGTEEWKVDMYYRIFDVFSSHDMVDANFAFVTPDKKNAMEIFYQYLLDNDLIGYKQSADYSYSSGLDSVNFYNFGDKLDDMGFELYIEMR